MNIDQVFNQHDEIIVQNGIVVVNDVAVYDVWSASIEDDTGTNVKMCMYDMNGMLMSSIDVDLIHDIEIIKMNENNEIIGDE